ncbi:related to TRL1 - tRNA ligase [Ustilago trichophora]|uniref:Related to TRL1 - tRNA ligase n=1 Tax=Ustilago trichophora TaxID=86804 RepID=A0A5C3E691_9BASI|nr:related to TRL1 - tRNA ligase [Ustilago trichophora]
MSAAEIPSISAEAVPVKVPNSPSTAFAALSLTHDAPSSSTNPIFTPSHLAELESTTALVSALDAARKQPKPLIRSTGHLVPSTSCSGAKEHHLLSWKVAEFAYRKSTSVGSELPTLARGLFTERLDTTPEKHRIVVRGYDKFFNLNEMAWTKPDSIEHYTTPPYVLTFKENGCIIFISSLSPTQLVVTSKHSLGSIEGTETTHAQKGHEWLLKHLASVNKTEEELAAELWKRNETAAFELCDDSFEEHVLAYSASRSGLHLHGLNSNSASFRTRDMPDVDAFANEWGFIPTRWLTLPSLAEVQRVTNEIEQTGAWEGEPIEGFVIRTHMPDVGRMEELKNSNQAVISPPYQAGQAWFYKVKFDEPYLMYRDWRELARKMVKEKAEYEAKLAALPPSVEVEASSSDPSTSVDAPSSESNTACNQPKVEGEKSKAALKRERKALAKASAKSAASNRALAQAAGLLPPSPPQPRSKRPETLLFIQWCYDRLYGNPAQNIKPQPSLFAGLAQNKGIIAMRDAFLSYLSTQHPTSQSSVPSQQPTKKDTRDFTKTILTPIAVPGCGKTVLAVALGELFGVGLVQSDDFKKKGGFLTAIERDLRLHSVRSDYVVFADKNNHLFQHRDELIDLSARLSACNAAASWQSKKGKQQVEVGRIRTVALAWDLDCLPLNTLHRICAERIQGRGDNHQTLVADPNDGAVSGLKSHETVLWRFLEALQPFGSSEGLGEGGEGYGDGRFDEVVRLKVADSAEGNLRRVIEGLGRVLGWEMPSDERIGRALETAFAWKVKKGGTSICEGKKAKQEGELKKDSDASVVNPRYFGLAVELDTRLLLDGLLLQPNPNLSSNSSNIVNFYRRMRSSRRLNQRPHITLVHRSNLSSWTTLANESDLKWEFYSNLLYLQQSREEAIFNITFSTVLYETDTLLTIPIDTITAPSRLRDRFNALHGDDWTPHITLCTSEDVRPYEANRVVSTWLANNKLPTEHVVEFQLENHITVEARIFGMS